MFSSSAPSAAPTTLPLPPKIATPPTTTAAIDRELVPGAGGRVDRAVLGGPEHAGDAGDRAAEHERREDAAARSGCPASRAASGFEPIA